MRIRPDILFLLPLAALAFAPARGDVGGVEAKKSAPKLAASAPAPDADAAKADSAKPAAHADVHSGESHGVTSKAGAHGSDGHDVAGHGKDGDHGDGHGMLRGKPRQGLLGKGTEFLAIDIPMMIWTWLVFIPLFLFLTWFVWKPVLKSLHDREHAIEESLKHAEEVREEARKLVADHEAWMGKAHGEAKELLEKIRAEAGAEADAKLAAAKSDAEKSQKQAAAEIESARSEALKELEASAGGLSAALAAQLLKRDFTTDDVARFTGEVRG